MAIYRHLAIILTLCHFDCNVSFKNYRVLLKRGKEKSVNSVFLVLQAVWYTDQFDRARWYPTGTNPTKCSIGKRTRLFVGGCRSMANCIFRKIGKVSSMKRNQNDGYRCATKCPFKPNARVVHRQLGSGCLIAWISCGRRYEFLANASIGVWSRLEPCQCAGGLLVKVLESYYLLKL